MLCSSISCNSNNVTNSTDDGSVGERCIRISTKNSHQPGTNNSLESIAPSIAALYRYVYWAEEGVAKSTVSNARNVAPLAAPGSAVDQRKVAPEASPNSVAKCEQFSLSEGFDLFKAICDLVHRRYKAWSVVVVYIFKKKKCCFGSHTNRAQQSLTTTSNVERETKRVEISAGYCVTRQSEASQSAHSLRNQRVHPYVKYEIARSAAHTKTPSLGMSSCRASPSFHCIQLHQRLRGSGATPGRRRVSFSLILVGTEDTAVSQHNEKARYTTVSFLSALGEQRA